jgi:hypothetical protein
MTKQLGNDAVGKDDLTEYLDKYSDFAFELTVLRMLDEHGFTCEHGGSYDDPVTQITREFDLRATKKIGSFRIRLAVECKHLSANFPLLISSLPRRPEEAFHEIIYSSEIPLEPLEGFDIPALRRHVGTTRLYAENSIYKPNESVGKSSAQVGRQKDGTILSGDSEVYKKWAQATSSAQDLIDRANDEQHCYSVVFPVLVVPDGTLWLASFDANGSRRGMPHQVDRCPYFMGKAYSGGDNLSGFTYHISHLEFVTPTGLEKLNRELFERSTVQTIFPKDTVGSALFRSI